MKTTRIPKAIEEISMEWAHKAPFFTEFLIRFKYIEDESFPTIGVGMHKFYVSCIYNPEFINSLSEHDLKFVLIHEILHLIKNHHSRFAKISEQNMQLYNIAADIVINEEIISKISINGNKFNRLESNKGVFLTDIPDYTGKLVSEEIYEFLMKKQKEQPKSSQMQSNQSSSNSNQQQTSNEEIDSDDLMGQLQQLQESRNEEKSKQQNTIEDLNEKRFDVHDKFSQLKTEEASIAIEEMINSAYSRSWGQLSGETSSFLKELRKPVRIPINALLRNKMQMTIYGYHGNKMVNWNKVNRRSIDLLCGNKRTETKLVVVVDTSGSVYTQKVLEMFFTEIDFISQKVKDITLIQFDTEVKSVTKYKKGIWKTIDMAGGGGTQISPVFDYLKQKKLNDIPVICFTDGEFNWNINHYNINPLWVIYNKYRDFDSVDFGRVFNIKE